MYNINNHHVQKSKEVIFIHGPNLCGNVGLRQGPKFSCTSYFASVRLYTTLSTFKSKALVLTKIILKFYSVTCIINL